MRKIVGLAAVGALAVASAATACRSTPGARGAGAAEPGGASAVSAVERFVQAAGATDVRTMGTLFGTRAGPVAARDPESEVEKRMRALACYLGHDAARVVDDLPATSGGRSVTVELRQRELVRRPRFVAVAGPGGRWFVESFEIDALADFCRPR